MWRRFASTWTDPNPIRHVEEICIKMDLSSSKPIKIDARGIYVVVG